MTNLAGAWQTLCLYEGGRHVLFWQSQSARRVLINDTLRWLQAHVPVPGPAGPRPGVALGYACATFNLKGVYLQVHPSYHPSCHPSHHPTWTCHGVVDVCSLGAPGRAEVIERSEAFLASYTSVVDPASDVEYPFERIEGWCGFSDTTSSAE